MELTNIFSMLGGLALFLYGMTMMSNGLELAAGNKMKSILEKLTTNRFLGVAVGALITAIIQSSSAVSYTHLDVYKRQDKNRLTMSYMGQTVVDIDRGFLDKNGASRYQNIHVELPDFDQTPFDEVKQTSFVKTSKDVLSRLSVCSQKGLVERFDSSIGNGTVLSPFGGKTLRTETEGMVALIPVLQKETTTCSIMSYGYNPVISKWSPYHGSIYAIVESIAKIVAMGGDYHTIRFSFQEYFEKLLDIPEKWGKPFAALLGAYRVQSEMKLPSIGGKRCV